jgi:hypothetical protein
MSTFDFAIESLKNERSKMLKTIAKLKEQVSCEHPIGERFIQMDAGFDADAEGTERQHLETCKKCGAKRLHCDHSEHGKSIGCWFGD